MSKIKLLILYSINLILIVSCVKNQPNYKFDINYISGGIDGLIFRNLVHANIKSFNLYDPNSNLKINISINHQSSLFVTNVNNTSDRQSIISTISATIRNEDLECDFYQFQDSVNKFFVISSNIKYMSNNKATEEIKKNNAEILINKFIKNIIYLENINCK